LSVGKGTTGRTLFSVTGGRRRRWEFLSSNPGGRNRPWMVPGPLNYGANRTRSAYDGLLALPPSSIPQGVREWECTLSRPSPSELASGILTGGTIPSNCLKERLKTNFLLCFDMKHQPISPGGKTGQMHPRHTHASSYRFIYYANFP
jgi:hypothetical protein